MRSALVLGGGTAGSAIARALAGTHRVVVASPTARPHAGLWRQWTLADPVPAARDADVWVALRPERREAAGFVDARPGLVDRLWRAGAASITLLLPAGADPREDAELTGLDGPEGARVTVLRVAPAWSTEDRCVGPIVRALRAGRAAHHLRGIDGVRALAADDLARAALRLAGTGGVHVLVGVAPLSGAEIGQALVRRYGGRCTERWMGGLDAEDRAWIERQRSLPDSWDDERLGPRVPFARWADRLPGPRRQR